MLLEAHSCILKEPGLLSFPPSPVGEILQQSQQVNPQTNPPPSVGGLDLNSSNSGCAHLGSGVAPPLGVVKEEVAVLIALVRRHRRAVGAAVRRAVDDEVPGAVEEEAGPAARLRGTSGLPRCPW